MMKNEKEDLVKIFLKMDDLIKALDSLLKRKSEIIEKETN